MKKQISVRIEEDIAKQLKQKLTLSDESIQSFLEEKISEYIEKNNTEKTSVKEQEHSISRIMKESNPIWLQSDLRKRLIEINKTIESELAHFDVILPTASDEILLNLEPSLIVTCKKMFDNYKKMSKTINEIQQIKNTYNIQKGENRVNMGSLLESLRPKISFKRDILQNNSLSKEQKNKLIRDLVLTFIADNHKISFSHYDVEFGIEKKKHANGRMMAISLPGRDHPNAPMTKFIEELANSTNPEDFSSNIINYTVEAMSNFLEELEDSKNYQRKRKYANLFRDSRLIRLFITIGIIQAGNYCIKKEIDLEHTYFETVLRNAEKNKSKISRYYREYSRGLITEEELTENLNRIYENFKKNFEERIFGEVQGKVMVEIGQYKQDLASIEDIESISTYLSYIGVEAIRTVNKHKQRTLNEEEDKNELGFDVNFEF